MQPYRDGEEDNPGHQLRVGPSWMDPIVLYLKDEILPEEKGKADKM